MEDKNEFKTYKLRFAIIALFGLSNATNAFLWIVFSPIAPTVMERYDVSNLAVNMLSLVFMILYLPGSVLGVYLLERYGMRNSLMTGAALNFLCAWLRFFGDRFIADKSTAFAIVMCGQIIGALAQPLFTNLPSRIAADWFPESQRDIATVFAAMTNPLGNAAGSVVPSLLVSAPGDIASLMLYQGIWTAVILVFVVLTVRDRPPTPPSAAAALRLSPIVVNDAYDADAAVSPFIDGADDTTTQLIRKTHVQHAGANAAAAIARLRDDFKALFNNSNFLRLMTAFGIGLGVFNAILTLLAQYILPCNYGSDTAGAAGGALLGAGLIGAVLVGILLEKTRAYVTILKGGIVGSIAATLFMLGSMRENGEAQLIASFAVLGLCLVPLLPVSLENAAECTYPVPEDNSAALLLLMGQLVGIIMIFALTPMMNLNPQADCSSIATPAAGLILGTMAIAVVVLLTFKRDYRRQAAAHSRKPQTLALAASA